MTIDDIDLTELRRRWAARRADVDRIMARIDLTGMTRPARDPDERAWLEERGEAGPFVEDEAAGRAARAYYARKYNRPETEGG